MTVDLTAEEMERILLALKLAAAQRRQTGLSPDEEERLVARLEVVQREAHRTPGRR